MSRVRTAALLICVLATALALPGGASASKSIDMLNAVNMVRAQHGLPAVHYSRTLAHSAHSYSATLMRTGYFGHDSRIHASRRFRTLGEILEWRRGLRPAVWATLRDWMNSPPHRAVILDGEFRYAGAGYVRGRFHGRRATIWAMHFGRK
jgi:uncharacterized protein YkwD